MLLHKTCCKAEAPVVGGKPLSGLLIAGAILGALGLCLLAYKAYRDGRPAAKKSDAKDKAQALAAVIDKLTELQAKLEGQKAGKKAPPDEKSK